MMKTYKSSINFKKSVGIAQIEHNENLRPGYRINDHKPLVNKPTSRAVADRQRFIDKAIDDYMSQNKSKNPRFQAKDYDYSAVVNIKPDTTLDDLQRLADFLHDDYGFQCYQIAIHRDEGHIDIDGKPHINQHAHMEFVTLDDITGKNNYRKINRTALRKIQDKTAQILGMERGEYIENSKVKRIEPRAYAQLKEQEKQATKELKADLEKEKAENKALKQDLASQKAVNSAFEEIRQLMIADKISTADDYKELAKYKKQAQAQAKSKDLTKEQLNIQIAQIQQSYNDKLKAKDEEIEKLEKALEPISTYTEPLLDDIIDIYTKSPADAGLYIKKLWREREQDRQDYKRYKKELEEDYKNKLADNEPTSQNNSDDVKEQILTLEKQNKDLKANNDTLTLENQTLKSELSYIKQFLEINNLVDKIKSFFNNIGKKLSMEFKEPKVQEPNHAQQKQDIQLTPIKSAWEIKRDEKNKGRGGR